MNGAIIRVTDPAPTTALAKGEVFSFSVQGIRNPRTTKDPVTFKVWNYANNDTDIDKKTNNIIMSSQITAI